MSTPNKQSDDQKTSPSSIPEESGTLETGSSDNPDGAEETPSEVALRINLLGKLVIPPPQS